MATDFQKKKRTDRLHHILIAAATVAALAICIVLVVANVNIYHKKQRLNTRIESLKTQIASLQKENSQLEDGIANANNDAYIEKVAREELGLQKSGEKVVSFVQVKPEENSQKGRAGVLGAWLGWISGWLR